LYRKFEQEGTLKEENRPLAPIVRSAENAEAFQVAMQRSPGKSTGKSARE
jgi:hypothetical protein